MWGCGRFAHRNAGQLSELSCRAAINITTSTGKDSGLEKGNQS